VDGVAVVSDGLLPGGAQEIQRGRAIFPHIS
jgi:hypothetical protein